MTVARQSLKLTTCFLLLSISAWCRYGSASHGTTPSGLQYSYEANGFRFTWDLQADRASLSRVGSAATLWQGGLLPAFWIKAGTGRNAYVKGEATLLRMDDDSQSGQISLSFRELGTG